MKKIIILLLLIIPFKIITPSEEESEAEFYEYQKAIASYRDPVLYKFVFYCYRDPNNRRGLTEVIETSHILCEYQDKKEFDIDGFKATLPKHVGVVQLIQTTQRDPMNFHADSVWYYIRQETIHDYQHELAMYKKNPFIHRPPTGLKRCHSQLVKAIRETLDLKHPFGKSYTTSQKLYNEVEEFAFFNKTIYIDQQLHEQTRSQTSTRLPQGIFYRTQDGKMQFTEEKSEILINMPTKKSMPKETIFLYIEQEKIAPNRYIP